MPAPETSRDFIESQLRALRSDRKVRMSFEVRDELTKVHHFRVGAELRLRRRVTGGREPLSFGMLLESRPPATSVLEQRARQWTERDSVLMREYELTRAREQFIEVRREFVDQVIEALKRGTAVSPELRGRVTLIHSPSRGAFPDAYIFGTVAGLPVKIPNPELQRWREQNIPRVASEVRERERLQRDRLQSRGMGALARPQPSDHIWVPGEPQSELMLRIDWSASEIAASPRPAELSRLERTLDVIGSISESAFDIASIVDGVLLIRWGSRASVRFLARRAMMRADVETATETASALSALARGTADRGVGTSARTRIGESLGGAGDTAAAGRTAGREGISQIESAAARRVRALQARVARDEAREVGELVARTLPKASAAVRNGVQKVLVQYPRISRDEGTLRGLSEIFRRTLAERVQRSQLRAAAGELAVLKQLASSNRAIVRIEVVASRSGTPTADFLLHLSTGEVRTVQAEIRTVTRARARETTRARATELPAAQRGARGAAEPPSRFSETALRDGILDKIAGGQITERGVVIAHMPYAAPEGTTMMSAKNLDILQTKLAKHPEVLEVWLSVPTDITDIGRQLWRIDRNAGDLGIAARLPPRPTVRGRGAR
ncbi:hypothetical protein [Microlunatus sp. GCM10028923]|uniref:hypothetical protein n=1 Tax=Microlunatus sp. GCM10028923 TaxID=3273400 RepID=UPI00360CE47E